MRRTKKNENTTTNNTLQPLPDRELQNLWRGGKWLTSVWIISAIAFIVWKRGWCLPANAIGDMLAGLFAPLIFGWFVIATMMQRKELQLQREELGYVREEMARQATALERTREIEQQNLLLTWRRDFPKLYLSASIARSQNGDFFISGELFPSEKDLFGVEVTIHVPGRQCPTLSPAHIPHLQNQKSKSLQLGSLTPDDIEEIASKQPNHVKIMIKIQADTIMFTVENDGDDFRKLLTPNFNAAVGLTLNQTVFIPNEIKRKPER